MLMREQPEFFWFVVGALLLANVFLYIFGMTGIRMFSKIVEVPKPIIIPIIVVLTFIGGYSIQNSIADIYWMIGFGITGLFHEALQLSRRTHGAGCDFEPDH